MALSVNTNIQALNAYRNLNKTQSALSNSLEKLSSGLRINRAADDAAGLAISENLKAQIGGIQQASKNAQDGVSLVQTADGALSQTQTILQRLRTLAVASANGSQSSSSRAAINSEATSLKSELTRISQTSNFNGVNLLDGTLKTAATFQIGYRADNAASGIAGNVISVAIDSGAAATVIGATSGSFAVTGTVFSGLAGGASASGALGDYDFSSTVGKTFTALVGNTVAASVALVAATVASGAGGGTSVSVYDFSSSGVGAISVNVVLNGVTKTLVVNSAVVGATGLASALQTQADGAFSVNHLAVSYSAASGIFFSAGSAEAGGASSNFTFVSIATVAGNSALTAASYGFGTAGATATAGKSAQSFSTVVQLNGVTANLAVTTNVTNQHGLVAALNTQAAAAFGASRVIFTESAGGGIGVVMGGAERASLTAASVTGANSNVGILSVSLGAANSAIVYGLSVGTSYGQTASAAVAGSSGTAVLAGAFDANGLGVASIDLSNQVSAQAAIANIDAAITQVSTSRANLGALQNRFQYTVDNLDTTAENLSSAQSRILDTDMASEMVSFTRSQILSQAGSAMLAQAKNLPNSLLELLKS